MKFGTTKDTKNIESVIKKSQNFEVSLADSYRKSEKRAWIVAGCSGLLSLILIGGYFYILPMKEKVPYLVMADAYTGTSSIARLSNSTFSDEAIRASEAINKSNVSHFLTARESYDKPMIGLRDWATVFSMAKPDVSNLYKQWLDENNPNSPLRIYGDTNAIRIKILSIVLRKDDQTGGKPNGATVRFQRILFNKQTGANSVIDNKIATLEFSYNRNLKMDEPYRIENPLGFQVTAYRVDNDYSSALPESVEANSPSATTTPVDNTHPQQTTGQGLPPSATPANSTGGDK